MRSVLRLRAVLRTLFAALLLFVLQFELMHTASLCPQDHVIQPCKCSERSNEVQIWCSYGDLNSITNALRAISQSVSKEIDELILENNLLPSLPGQMFSSIKILRLMLRENGLQRVSANWLAGLETSLQEIYLVEPELRSFPDDSLITLPKLEALTLSAGSITKMPAIFGLSRLRYIQIEASSLTDVHPNNFQGLPLLEQLHITSAPKIKRLDEDTIHDLPRLSILNFTQCGLSYIHPRAFTRLPALTELSFTANKFSDARMVGIAVRDLQNLATLRLDRNLVNRLEEATFVDIPSLRNLYLNDNRIGTIFRAAFHRLPLLRSLDLSNNQIHVIHPESFLPARENSLEELWLNNNQIEHSFTIRLLLDSLPNLRLLDMSNNFMEELSYGIVQSHSHLEMLILENNRLKRIGRESFVGLPSLRELKLRNNSLSYHIGTPYWNLPALKGLDLSRNNFEHIDRFLLNGLPSLRRFDISYNSLKSIEAASFVGSPFLEHVNVSKNNLNIISPSTFAHLQRLFDLDVSNNNLSQVVSGIPRNIEYLYAAGNNIMVIPTSVMHEFQLSALKLLDLSGNKIHKVPATSFSSLCTLRTLLLNDNYLQMIEQSTFENLPQLRVLNLAYNKIISINRDAFKKLKHLSELNLRRNRLEIFESALVSQNSELKRLDISSNRLTEIPSNAFSNNKKIEELNLSENSLIEFPSAISGMPTLHTLDLSRNQMRILPTNVLPSLPTLREIHLSGNKLQSLTQGVFNKLQNLSILDLENNEIERIGSHALNSLPSLVMAKMSKNKISNIASSAFADLPALQSVELQENMLVDVANDAFTACPNLLMLNLSNNLLTSMDKAGLNGIKTLEALDLSHNKISHLSVDNVRDMNFLVLLKMDNNRLCNIQGTPFEKMSRLRMLSLRDNKMTTLQETTFNKLRSTIMYFDIEGNPVKCSCNMLWLHSWLQEEYRHPGPRCSDGILLREHRISKNNCEDVTEIVPGCESSFSINPTEKTIHVPVATVSPPTANSSVLPGVAQVQPTPKPNSYLKPLPEETDYFDPKFIEYHENNPKTIPQNKTTIPPEIMSHFISGDTPTIFAGARQKNNTIKPTVNSNQGSAFTFFGMPIPSLNLNNFWNSGKSLDKQKKDGRRESWPPSEPEIQKDGFVPLLPGEGGFVPMNITTPKNHTVHSHHVSGHATISKVSLPTSTQRSESIDVENFYDNDSTFRANRNVSHNDPIFDPSTKSNFVPIPTANVTRVVTDNRRYSTTETPKTTFISEPVFSSESAQDDSTFSDRISDVVATKTVSDYNDTFIKDKSDSSFRPSPLSEFLVPGGQITPDSHSSTGRPAISKVQLISGPSPQNEDVHTSHLRLAKSSLHSSTTTTTEINNTNNRKNDSLNWYYTNYNRSNLEPYVGRLPIKYSSSHQNLLSLPLFLINGLILYVIF